MVNYNTKYYRRNKEQQFKVHKCCHCSYQTTGPKSSLMAHIWAKHTEEKNRPFQCPCNNCSRGYSAKANLHKHLKQQHNIEIPKDKDVFAYSVRVNKEKKNLTNSERERINIYINNIVIPKKIPQKLQNIITIEQLYYDHYNKIITLQGYTKKYVIQLHKNVINNPMRNTKEQ
jgi:hypothetical protein